MPRNVFIQLSLVPLPQRQSAFLVGSQRLASEGSLVWRWELRAASLFVELELDVLEQITAGSQMSPATRACVQLLGQQMVAAELVPHREGRSLKGVSKHLEPPIQISALYNLSMNALFFNCG